MRYVIIDSENKVVNVIITDQEFVAPRNHAVVQSENAQVGNTYDSETGLFSA